MVGGVGREQVALPSLSIYSPQHIPHMIFCLYVKTETHARDLFLLYVKTETCARDLFLVYVKT